MPQKLQYTIMIEMNFNVQILLEIRPNNPIAIEISNAKNLNRNKSFIITLTLDDTGERTQTKP